MKDNQTKKSHLNNQTVASLKMLAGLMDDAFTIPGTSLRFGLDSVIGLIPGIGDTLGLAISGYIYSHAKKAGVPWHTRLKMLWNIVVDWLIGIIPFIGDIFDVGWKANSKNIKIIIAHHEAQKAADVIEGDYTKIT